MPFKDKLKRKEYSAEYRKKNADKIRIMRLKTRKHDRELERIWYKKNREKKLKNCIKWRKKNVEHRRQYERKRTIRNKEKNKKYYQENKIKYKKVYLKRHYNITIEDYKRMFREQKGKCEICNKKETAKDSYNKLKRLSVDHNHKTGNVRGLLCQRCNTGVGYFMESIESLKGAIKYLRKYN